MNITPAILPRSYDELVDKLSIIKDDANRVQIDVCDGIFVPSKTWPYDPDGREHFNAILKDEEGLPFWENLEFEVDLMVSNPLEAMEEWARVGAARIIVHWDSMKDPQGLVDRFDDVYGRLSDTAFGVKLGLAIGVESDLEKAVPLLHRFSFIQCMGITRIGYQGQLFDRRVLERISELKTITDGKEIQVDGGVNMDNATELAEAGVDNLVIGSAIFDDADPQAAFHDFSMLG